jgi:phage anti-repressor protein
MNNLIKKKPSELITPESINFTELVRNSNTTLSLSNEYQSKMITLLNEEFTEQQSQWYIANLYIYMNYHPTNDYPINLEHVFKMIGFANKGNAKRTLENNFTKDEDYKILLIRTEKQLHGGHNEENIMLNTDTFKSLCMLAKTDKGKEIRKYYVKLENIYNRIIKHNINLITPGGLFNSGFIIEVHSQYDCDSSNNAKNMELANRNDSGENGLNSIKYNIDGFGEFNDEDNNILHYLINNDIPMN